jgi:hypothetical protein
MKISAIGIQKCIATGLVESNLTVYANVKVPESLLLPHDRVGDDGHSVGALQQQVRKGANGKWWWGDAKTCMDPTSSARLFYQALARLDYTRGSNPGMYAQAVQQSAYPDRYQERMPEARDIFHRLIGQAGAQAPIVREGKPVGWTGDPVWLEDVLREALGDRLKTLSGWQTRGHGDFLDVRGIVVHHTGNSRESAESIARGRPDLPGPLSQIHIDPQGIVTIVAVGVAWHAGAGSYPDFLPNNMANQHMIGIECAWPTIHAGGGYDENEAWPDAQIISMRDTCAAIMNRLNLPAGRVIGHKEWAGSAQGKWDPGAISMPWWRAEVAKAMKARAWERPDVVIPELPPPPPVRLPKPANERTDRLLLEEIWDQLRGPNGRGWPQLGGLSVVDALAKLLEDK